LSENVLNIKHSRTFNLLLGNNLQKFLSTHDHLPAILHVTVSHRKDPISTRNEIMVELSSMCQTLTPPPFDLATFLTGALQLRQTSQLTGKSPSTFEKIHSQSSISPVSDGRKRRRGELINPANTLDGLVARRADDTHEPFQKRYLTEQEAIEGPDDEAEAKRMESDPDVSTRTCSTCGYVGKWISEMIRHKRVHTNERPFKCRYCSRTSKWKADLIRHVAKTHGIRVVSKYSRSKAFDQATTNLANRDDEDKPRVFACEPDKEPERQKQPPNGNVTSCEVTRPEPLVPGKTPLSYRCSQCFLEQPGLSVLVHHLRTAHNKCPYECRCRTAFNSIGDALNHATTSLKCSSDDLVLNVIPIYNNRYHASSTTSSGSLSPTRSRNECSPDSGVQVDMDELDMERISCIPQKTVNNNSGNESVLAGLLAPSLLPTTNSKAALPSSLDLSAALLSLQLPFSLDYLAAMTSILNSSSSFMLPVIDPTPYKCGKCGVALNDISSFVAHSCLHFAQPPLTTLGADLLVPFQRLGSRDELVDVEM
uniref:C2H2-type domain-containing protein n=1 Tax=Haemonchus contortus TaxID=6289 RepID=A0A7I4XVR5_HAECO